MTYGLKPLLAKLFGGSTDVSNQLLRKWNLSLIFLYGLQAAAMLLLTVPRNYPLNVTFATSDALQTKLQHMTVTAPAIHQVGTLNVAYLVAGWFIVAAIAHLLAATILRTRYEVGLKRATNAIRGTQLTVESAVVLVVLALMAGVYDAGSLLVLVLFAAITSMLLWALRVGQQPNKRPTLGWGWLRRAAVVSGVAPLALLLLYIVAAAIFGDASFTWASVGVCLSAVLVALLLLLNGWLTRTKRGRWTSYRYGELWYMALNFIGLTLLGWELFAAVLHP